MNQETAKSSSPVVLVVDDTPETIEPIVHSLRQNGFRARIATTGELALTHAAAEPLPELILLDVMLPDISGYDICRRLKENPATAEIPVIFLTSRSEEGDEQRGFDVGAVDYITKPISPPLVLRRVRTHLNLKAAGDLLRDRNDWLQREVEKRTREVSAIQDVTITAMASLAETRDEETGNHIRRTQLYVLTLAEHLCRHPHFSGELTHENRLLMYKSAPLHDIGKVGIPDHILLKPGKLTPEEFEIMKTHAMLGYEAILKAEKLIGTPLPFLRYAKEIARGHHEKWNGSGYPSGLAGEDIPLSARLMAVADVYDALVNRRIYKPPFSHEDAVKLITEGRGTHFDPDVVDAFLELADEFHRIALKFAEEDESAGVGRGA